MLFFSAMPMQPGHNSAVGITYRGRVTDPLFLQDSPDGGVTSNTAAVMLLTVISSCT